MTPQLQKARERFCGEPLPDHLHNKAIQRRGLTLPPGRSATTRPGHISRLVLPNGPGLARVSTSRSTTVPSERGMRSSSSPPSRDQLWSLTLVARSPDHAVSGHWSLNLIDPGSAF